MQRPGDWRAALIMAGRQLVYLEHRPGVPIGPLAPRSEVVSR